MSVVTSCNSRIDFASGVFCGSAPRLYDLSDRVQVVSAVQFELSSVKWSELVGG